MRYVKLSDMHMRIFDSVEDVIDQCRQVPNGNLPINLRGISREDFVGRLFRSRDEVYDAARAPWPEGVAIIDRMVRELESEDLPKPKSRRRRPRFREDDGDELDYDRLRSGQSFWRQCQRESHRGPQTVTIVIDLNANHTVSHENIMWRGAAAIAMTKILEEAGFRVVLWTVHCANRLYADSTGHCHAVCLKRAGDPLDIATFASAVSGWFYRSLMFHAKGINGRVARRSGGDPRRPWMYEVAEFTHDPNAIVISGAYSESMAVWLAKRALKKLAGIEDPPPPPAPAPEPAPEQPKPKTPAELRAELRAEAAERKRREAERKRREKEMRAWRKQWEKDNREC